jgi:hypothetical protein
MRVIDLLDVPTPDDGGTLADAALQIAHVLVEELDLSEEVRIHALDDVCAAMRHQWLLAGRSFTDTVIDAQAFRTMVHRAIVALEAQQRRKRGK